MVGHSIYWPKHHMTARCFVAELDEQSFVSFCESICRDNIQRYYDKLETGELDTPFVGGNRGSCYANFADIATFTFPDDPKPRIGVLGHNRYFGACGRDTYLNIWHCKHFPTTQHQGISGIQAAHALVDETMAVLEELFGREDARNWTAASYTVLCNLPVDPKDSGLYDSLRTCIREKLHSCWLQVATATTLHFQDHGRAVYAVDITEQLFRWLGQAPERLCGISPDDFEFVVAELIHKLGFFVHRTGATNRADGGFDFIAYPNEERYQHYLIAGQIKHHRNPQTPTSVSHVRELRGAMATLGVPTVGMLVTNTSFTPAAIAEAGRRPAVIHLRGFPELAQWLVHDSAVHRCRHEMPTSIEIARGLSVQVPRGLLDPFS
jgi:hypothetical protein